VRFSIVVPGVPCKDSEVLGIPCLEIHPTHSPFIQGHPSGRSQTSSERTGKGMKRNISSRYFNLEESQN